MFGKHIMLGEINYPGKGIITDEDCWKVVKAHSTIFDRLDPLKMVEMTISAQLILMGLYEGAGYFRDNDWMFYKNRRSRDKKIFFDDIQIKISEIK